MKTIPPKVPTVPISLLSRVRGFTLVEIGVVLVILGLIALTLMPRLGAKVEQQRFEEDQRVIRDARQALLNFVTTQGRLPCPDPGTNNGFEAVTVITPAPSLQVACQTAFGYLPARTLGLSQLDTDGKVLNPWGRATGAVGNGFALRYAVTDLSGGPAALNQALVNIAPVSRWPFNGQRRDDIVTALNPGNTLAGVGISLCTTAATLTLASTQCDATGAVHLTDLIAVIISPGANGATNMSATEVQNNLAGAHTGRTFYFSTFVGSLTGDLGANTFDDRFETLNLGDMQSALSAGGWIVNN
jgi:type II secretory pathway pseudopilin PulG